MYYAQWHDFYKSPDRMFYILYPRGESNIIDGHCAETDALILAAGKWTSQLHQEIFVFDDGYWEKSRELWNSIDGSSWDDVILDPEMQKDLIEDVQSFFDNQNAYKQYAVPWKRGIILHGVPGNGKTASIKALMSSLYARSDAIPTLYVKSLETSRQTKKFAVRRIFQKARNQAPCLLIFEDLDSLIDDGIRSYFLNEVDGLENNEGVLIIGSTNHLDKLDPAIARRPSRFDRKYHFKIPGEKERRLYAEYWRNKLTYNKTIDFPEELASLVAKLTVGFSFAYLKELFVATLLRLMRCLKGDDFEIEDADEAASVDEDKKPDDADAEKEEEEVCTCASKCATCQKPLPKVETKKDGNKDDSTLEVKPSSIENKKMVMPTVDIPSHLSENLLFKVIKHQIHILHVEMDNTKEES